MLYLFSLRVNRRFSNKTDRLSHNSVYSTPSMSLRRPKSIVTNRDCCHTSDQVQKILNTKIERNNSNTIKTV